jgi:hypothetical protein
MMLRIDRYSVVVLATGNRIGGTPELPVPTCRSLDRDGRPRCLYYDSTRRLALRGDMRS